jgi:hypothetical protein
MIANLDLFLTVMLGLWVLARIMRLVKGVGR